MAQGGFLPNNCIAPATDNIDIMLFIVGDESIEPSRAFSLVLGELIPQAGLDVFLLKPRFKWTGFSNRQAD